MKIRYVEELRESGIVRTHSGATPAQVRAAEKELGVRLPAEYRRLVRAYGWIDVYDRGVFGVGPEWKNGYCNASLVTFQTKYARHTIGLEQRYIVIGDESHLDVWCVDARRTGSPQSPVIHVDPERFDRGGRWARKVTGSIEEWLRNRVRMSLRHKRALELEYPGVYGPMGEILDRSRPRKTARRRS